MNKKRVIALGLATVLCATIPTAFGCSGGCKGCGNAYWFDANYTLNYVVTEENGQHILHSVEAWSDSESDSVQITTKCCNNYIWTSSNKAVMYTNKPAEHTYDIVCPELNK